MNPQHLLRPLLAAIWAASSLTGSNGSYARAQVLLRQGHTFLDKNGDGVACESLRRACPPGGTFKQHPQR